MEVHTCSHKLQQPHTGLKGLFLFFKFQKVKKKNKKIGLLDSESVTRFGEFLFHLPLMLSNAKKKNNGQSGTPDWDLLRPRVPLTIATEIKAFNMTTNGMPSFQYILIGSVGMLGILDVTQYTSWQPFYPPNMGCCSEVSDEYVGKFGFRDTKPNAA